MGGLRGQTLTACLKAFHVFPLYSFVAECALTELAFSPLLQEDELRMMRSLIDGEGAVGVVRRIRALREEIEAAEEEARQTYAVSRCVCKALLTLPLF